MKIKQTLQMLAISASVLLAFPMAANAASSVGSSQFVAKLYTEGLGRAPDQAGWAFFIKFWNDGQCNAARLKEQAGYILKSPEFTEGTPSNHERLFKLYRAALHRDPDLGGFNFFLGNLNQGAPWGAVVDSLLGSAEFAGRAGVNCGATPFGWQATPVFNKVITSTGNFAGGDSKLLQAKLDSAPAGSIVYLEQGAVVNVTAPLIIPVGVTLTTVAEPGKKHAGLLGRLVRAANFTAPMVTMRDNSKLRSVWVDGQRNRYGRIVDSINVLAIGHKIEVKNNVLTDSPGWSTMQYFGSGENAACSAGVVSDNLITAYGSSHYNNGWTDGLSIACEDTLVERNEILDATDVSIVVFRATPQIQRSIVRNNIAINAGNSAYGGYVADPLANGQGKLTHNFTGTQFTNNVLWTSPVAHMDIALSVGTRAWFGDQADMGFGASFTGNTSGTETVNASVGINIAGMINAKVQSNNLKVGPSTSYCSNVNVAAAVSAGYASGDLQPYTNIDLRQCIGH